MRRMYSKEQLQKLIDEVSRLIAIEELDKVVPVPTLADAGKVMIVNAQGTGYQLANGLPLLMENIEDKEGHKRFVEGEITDDDLPSGITQQYGKWSLSGTHLMIVDVLNIAANTTIGFTPLTTITIPEWLGQKLVALGSDWLSVKKSSIFKASDVAILVEKTFFVRKLSNTLLQVYILDSYSEDYDSIARIEFDFLIDNE